MHPLKYIRIAERRLLVCVVVYDRFENLRHWLDCWHLSNHEGEQLAVIHNIGVWDERFCFLVKACRDTYVGRINVGYDIGAFQDLCNDRLLAVRDWERVLWVTDDVFPMSLDFVKQFTQKMTAGVGVACMEISNQVKRHIRTSAFMIDRKTAERLTFPADPVRTKRQCYEFEHMVKDAFLEQVERMGLKVVQVAHAKVSPLWDSGYKRRYDRRKEHEAIFGKMPEQPPFISKAEHLKNEI